MINTMSHMAHMLREHPLCPDALICDDGLTRPRWACTDAVLQHYYDTEWGMPIYEEQELYERLTLESFQSGLSWSTIMHKRPAFREAFAQFSPEKVAQFSSHDISRLMNNAAIVRNYRKICAAITNAQATINLRDKGGLAELIWSFMPPTTPEPLRLADIPTQSPQSRALSQSLRSHGFTFIGPTTMYALMEAIGMVDTHLLVSHRRASSGIW